MHSSENNDPSIKFFLPEAEEFNRGPPGPTARLGGVLLQRVYLQYTAKYIFPVWRSANLFEQGATNRKWILLNLERRNIWPGGHFGGHQLPPDSK
ncbi:hypothetical protein RUM43_002520 [Polyplax serrata]|uniref:Uncharacterized protein n=1 Tax=Polyplax serrata TaxID=468196 RepID=A0AAN8S620_POLSC